MANFIFNTKGIVMKLSELEPGKQGVISKVGGEGALRRHLLDMGLTPKTPLFVRKVAPMGDPMEICLRGYELTIRLNEAEQIDLYDIPEDFSCTGCCSSCKTCRGDH